jgi:hypothetical protein
VRARVIQSIRGKALKIGQRMKISNVPQTCVSFIEKPAIAAVRDDSLTDI